MSASAHFMPITPRHQRLLAALDAQRKVDHLGGIGWKALIDDDEAFDAEMLFLPLLMRGLIEDLSKTDLGPAGGRLFVRITPLGRVCSAFGVMLRDPRITTEAEMKKYAEELPPPTIGPDPNEEKEAIA